MERRDLLLRNADIFRSQGEAIDKVAKRNIKILVVGNPANTNALVLSKAAPGIPRRNISALTRLDQNRCTALIAQTFNVEVHQVERVAIWGNHSATQYPDFVNAVVTGATKKVMDVMGGHLMLANEHIPFIQKRGAAIIAARKLSSAMSAAAAICDHIRDWIYGSDGRVVSMAVFADGSYGIDEEVFFSFPVVCSNGGFSIVQDFHLGDFGRKYIHLSLDELLAERSEIM